MVECENGDLSGWIFYIEDNFVNVLFVEQMFVQWKGVMLNCVLNGVLGLWMVIMLVFDVVLFDM